MAELDLGFARIVQRKGLGQKFLGEYFLLQTFGNAVAMLREHARGTNTTLVETAQSVVDGQLSLEKP